MNDTGRIRRPLAQEARRILFGATADAGIASELGHISSVDQAHLLMLVECGIVDSGSARRLLQAIDELRRADFEPLRGRAAPRGLYLLYEDYLIEQLGPETGGILQTARSRNDLNATVLRLRLRDYYHRLLREALRLQASLIARAARYADVVMPIYTHYQAAMPVTYGHYLAGVAASVGRDIAGLFDAGRDLDRCPLGAGAVGGTALPIDTSRTSSLLGFEENVLNSIDAVGSRDLVLRLLSSAAILGVTLSRMATDMLMWSTAEFAFLSLPDEMVGSSSMMPQKRNPFLLEHVQARGLSALGGFVTAAGGMHATPFTNSIAVGTEATGQVWQPLEAVTEAAILARLVVRNASPQPEAMLDRAAKGYTSATELANRLIVKGGMAFRSAHHKVGQIVRAAVEQGEQSLESAASQLLAQEDSQVSLDGLDPASVARASIYGGGPGRESLDKCLESLRADWTGHTRRKTDRLRKWRAARQALDDALRRQCSLEATCADEPGLRAVAQ